MKSVLVGTCTEAILLLARPEKLTFNSKRKKNRIKRKKKKGK